MDHREPQANSWPTDVEAAYRQHLDALVVHARQVCPDHDSAEDACHNVFLRIVRTVRSAGSLALSYLVVAVRNECRDHLRRERKWWPLGPGAPEPETPLAGERDEDDLSLLLPDWRSFLSEHQQRALTLWADGLSHQEIANVLRVTTTTVRTHLNRAKAKLRMLARERREERGERREKKAGGREWGAGSRGCAAHSPAA